MENISVNSTALYLHVLAALSSVASSFAAGALHTLAQDIAQDIKADSVLWGPCISTSDIKDIVQDHWTFLHA
jgi:hypothetical protein